ncbi:hypothetical protein EC973_001287 [Apophysomyces ossiformis]|uniref:Uncharacterized protein n=1 Tax=Apophysomyces ossiformis TaxID=679940 RepID=A0A8H7BTU9_9FUNG|nr:hypothetical protein EC973_001287 [Apophysomyces ossiformis]
MATENPSGLRSAAWHFKRQRHMPYFLEYLMWVVFGSEALHLIWLKMEYKEYKEKSEHKIRLLREIVDRLEQGQELTEDFREEIRMVLLNGKRTEEETDINDEYLNKLIASSEEASSDIPATVVEEPKKVSNWPGQEEPKKDANKKKAFYL